MRSAAESVLGTTTESVWRASEKMSEVVRFARKNHSKVPVLIITRGAEKDEMSMAVRGLVDALTDDPLLRMRNRERMAAKGECLTFIVAVGVKAGDHKIILRGNSVTVDGKEMSEDEWEGGHSNIPMAISPVGRRVTNHQVKRVHHSELQSCRPDGDSSDWLWHNCTKVGWNIVTPELSLNIGVLGPFEEGWLKEEVSTRTFNLGVSQVRDEPSVRGIVNGDVNGLFQPAGEEYSTGKNAAYNVNQIPQVTAHNVGPAKSIFPENMRKMMDARCGASKHMRLTLAAAATASDMVDLRKRP